VYALFPKTTPEAKKTDAGIRTFKNIVLVISPSLIPGKKFVILERIWVNIVQTSICQAVKKNG
jgi:hypothetical protein